MRRISTGSPLIMQVIEHFYAHFGSLDNNFMSDPLGDIFLLVFVFEACVLTATKGGIQLDRLFLPNMVHIDLSEQPFLEFMECEQHVNLNPYRNILNSFSFLVQLVSRSFQSCNFDEPLLSILFYKCITEAVPINFRHCFADVNRDSLLTDLNRVDPVSFEQIQNTSAQIHQGTRAFKDAISSIL
ncbi:Nuclear receptor domain-containing protein [Caenorhabditis elegans]|nr:Nuclear receptor domain-containing protein [Caenorhabditis elegans]CDR32686.1 Nuclear receptor domain-containing protein [Caenorhabditis elegans]|eukprot:NP_001293921.1 Nuclear Hormone Receptor family [Caenorhabditis elegans]